MLETLKLKSLCKITYIEPMLGECWADVGSIYLQMHLSSINCSMKQMNHCFEDGVVTTKDK